MRIASTGLGKTELSAVIFNLKPEGDSLALYATTDNPEGCKDWLLETYLEPQDIGPVVMGFLRPSVLWLFVLAFLFPKKNPKEPEKL